MAYELYLANKTYSGWGLRVWLLFRHFKIPFHETTIPLYTDHHSAFCMQNRPARQFPTLVLTGQQPRQIIWDSLAITEFLAETYPEVAIWPKDRNSRSAARSLCSEIHGGLTALRKSMPVNLRRRYRTFTPNTEAQADIDRVVELWEWARQKFPSDGPYLFGSELSAADAFFAPIASRFRTYGVELPPPAQLYCDRLIDHPATQEFIKLARSEPWVLAHNEFGIA